MSENKGDIQFGIYLKEDNLRLVEVEDSTSHQFRINTIVQTRLDSSLDVNSIQNDQQVIEIGKQIRDIFNVFNIDIKKAIFTLQSSFAVVKKLPIDTNLSESRLIEQVHWEVKKFSYSTSDEYIVDFQKLNQKADSQISEIVVVSVREKIIQQLRKLFSAGKISVNVIDLDIFAAYRAVEINYDFRKDDVIVLAEIDHKGLQFTVIKDKEFYLTQEIPTVNLATKENSFTLLDDDETAKLFSKELRRIIIDTHLGEDIESLSRIFLYGDVVKDRVVEILQSNHDVRIDKINPFRKLFIGPKVSVDEKIWSHPETFTICVGSVLRN